VSKPTIIHSSSVGKKMYDAARDRLPSGTRVQMVKTETAREVERGGGEWGSLESAADQRNGHSAKH
jgi:hypothetical protein